MQSGFEGRKLRNPSELSFFELLQQCRPDRRFAEVAGGRQGFIVRRLDVGADEDERHVVVGQPPSVEGAHLAIVQIEVQHHCLVLARQTSVFKHPVVASSPPLGLAHSFTLS